MIEREIKVVNSLGIHARPAAMIVQIAGEYESAILLKKDGNEADAKSIMSVMMLAASQSTKITVRAEGPDEKAAVDALVEIFANGFDEE